MALQRCGTMNLARALAPGFEAAIEGFTVSENYAKSIRGSEKNLKQFQGSRAVFFHPNGKPFAEGENLVQADLANTYRNVAGSGIDWFYRGPLAKTVGDWMAKHGGIMTAADFARYEPKLREPLETTYHGYKIIGFPPPSSGGIHVAQILNILENFDLKSLARNDSAMATHITAEAMKLAFADRAYWLGDADFVAVPRGLISKDYAKTLAAKIDGKRAVDVPSHGSPPNWPSPQRSTLRSDRKSSSPAPASSSTTRWTTSQSIPVSRMRSVSSARRTTASRPASDRYRA
jgi:gamma-glutamyltranspeptidase/glutathione hydrolase